MTAALRLAALLVSIAALAAPSTALAQTDPSAPAPSTPAAPTSPQGEGPDPDLQLNPAQPEFTLGSLPTTLRMPSGKFAFRLTHRFSRPIGEGDAGDFFADFFGFDSSARVGFELRYGIRPGTQATVHRTNERSIQFLGQQEVLRQSDGRALTVHALGAVEGHNNFSEDFSATLGAVLSRTIAERAAFYAQPTMVFNADPVPGEFTDDNHAFFLGLGARLRIGQGRTYVIVEGAPRLTGYDAGSHHVAVAIERRAGGHTFQFTVTNSFATTMRQIARGGPGNDDWYVGFNLTRKFY